MSLRFSIGSGQIKHLKGAIQSLGKIGSELLIEAIPERMILRSINSSRTAYMSVTFHCGFFDSYSVFDAAVPQAGVLIKSVLAVFRAQKIRSMDVELNTQDTSMNFTLICGNGLRKTYMVQCLETEILQASVDKDQYPVTVVAETGELNRLLSTFQSSLDEIILICSPDTDARASKAVQLHSFFDPAKVNTDKVLRTQLAIDTHHVFLAYSNTLGEATDVTFNIKDFRCMVQLCEMMPANMVLRFAEPGHPLVVEPHLNDSALEALQYEAELVLATLMESKASLLQHDAARLTTPAAGRLHGPGATPARGTFTTPGIPGDTPMQRTPGVSTPGRQHAATGFTPAPSRFCAPGGSDAKPPGGRPGQHVAGDTTAGYATAAAGGVPTGAAHTPAPTRSGAGFSFTGQADAGRVSGGRPEASPAFPLWDAARAQQEDAAPQAVERSDWAGPAGRDAEASGSGHAFEAGRQGAREYEDRGAFNPYRQHARSGNGAMGDDDDDEDEEDEDAIPSTPPEKRMKS